MAALMEITTPLGPDKLLFHQLEAREALGRLFEYRIVVLSEAPDVDPYALLGKNVTVKLETADESPRHFDGCVTRFGMLDSGDGFGRYFRYEIVARPWLWFLTRSADCRIFQNQSVVDIIKTVFADYPNAAWKLSLSGSYEQREYCVQYRESDFDFVSRLMEQEGIYYFFVHEAGKHTLVLADSPSAHEPCPGPATLKYRPGEGGRRLEAERITEWRFDCEVASGKVVLDDFDFTKPSVELQKSAEHANAHSEAKHEWYDYPGAYDTMAEGETLARYRLDEFQTRHVLMSGATNSRDMTVGYLFTLEDHPGSTQNGKYLVTRTTHRLVFSDYETVQGEPPVYECSFRCMASDKQFRPRRTTPMAVVRGLHTAIVVGPSGDEIYTDEYGRVKVQFHWDRLGKQDENASCWIRVSHPWAGKNFGMIAIPRIGQEVVVEFLEGDPDRPLITGRVYNAEQMPPWALPANKTQTGVLTRSSTGGSAQNANAIRFEDKKGEEQLWIHAEKNQDIEVENDETHWVGHDRAKTIDHDETVSVGHDRTESVGNNETISIAANRTEDVGKDETISIADNRSESVGKDETVSIGANRAMTVGKDETLTVADNRTKSIGKDETIDIGDNRSTSIGKDDKLQVGKKFYLEAGDEITLKTGSASISMKKDGTITIKGKDITIQGSGKIGIKASSDVAIKGSKIAEN
jgi:type VI secretion system secreted protein VgrG